MARPKKLTVDYYPHFCKCGRTIFILENRFGNDGYAFWFKVLEILGESEGHFYDCSNASNWAFLLAKTHTTDEQANEIINVLIDLKKIDSELWTEHRVIWVENFVRNLSDVYRTRLTDVPQKPDFKKENPQEEQVSYEKTQQQEEFSAGEHTKEKKRIEKDRIEYPYEEIANKWNSVCGTILPKVVKLSAARKQKIKMRLIEFGKSEVWIPTIDTLFRKIIESDFLTGKNGDWTATFDWLFDSPKNWVKVLEGNYDNHKGGKSAAQQANSRLGVGEYIDGTGRRTYGSGRATIPQDAPPRPSESYCWNDSTKQWIIL